MQSRSELWSNGALVEVEIRDSATGTYTRTNAAGAVISTRALTADEIAALTAVDPRQALRDAIAAAESPAELQALLLQAIDQGIV